MNHDEIRKTLAPYLADLDILRDDVSGCTVKPFRNFGDKDFLRGYEINDAIKKLGGSWVKATKYTKAHWRIPREVGIIRNYSPNSALFACARRHTALIQAKNSLCQI